MQLSLGLDACTQGHQVASVSSATGFYQLPIPSAAEAGVRWGYNAVHCALPTLFQAKSSWGAFGLSQHGCLTSPLDRSLSGTSGFSCPRRFVPHRQAYWRDRQATLP
jgi:hypothetical protein